MSFSDIERTLTHSSARPYQCTSDKHSADATKKSLRLPSFKALALTACAVLATGWMWKDNEQATAVMGGWERSIGVERYGTWTFERWRSEMHNGARVLRCHNETRTYKPYKTEDKCTYEVDLWREESRAVASGALGTEPRWPETNAPEQGANAIGALRQGSRKETYSVVGQIGDHSPFNCDIPFAAWSQIALGGAFNVDVRKIGGAVCDSAQAVSPQKPQRIK